MISFLDLPAELRNQIYGYCTVVNSYASEYRGLFLSCKQVKHESISEILRVSKKILARIQARWYISAVLDIDVSSHYANLTVRLPASRYYRKLRYTVSATRVEKRARLATLGTCVVSLLELYLSKLIVTFYNDTRVPCRRLLAPSIDQTFLDEIRCCDKVYDRFYPLTYVMQASILWTQELIIKPGCCGNRILWEKGPESAPCGCRSAQKRIDLIRSGYIDYDGSLRFIVNPRRTKRATNWPYLASWGALIFNWLRARLS